MQPISPHWQEHLLQTLWKYTLLENAGSQMGMLQIGYQQRASCGVSIFSRIILSLCIWYVQHPALL